MASALGDIKLQTVKGHPQKYIQHAASQLGHDARELATASKRHRCPYRSSAAADGWTGSALNCSQQTAKAGWYQATAKRCMPTSCGRHRRHTMWATAGC